ncbi:TPA: hypothetical protein ACXXV6_002973 [Enterococcus faecium]
MENIISEVRNCGSFQKMQKEEAAHATSSFPQVTGNLQILL